MELRRLGEHPVQQIQPELMVMAALPPRTYVFKKRGTSTDHCSHCPLPPHEPCLRGCATEYENLLKERNADGVVVNDTPS